MIAKTKRILELFPQITDEDTDYLKYFNKNHILIEKHIHVRSINRVKIGNVEFLQLVHGFYKTLEGSETIKIELYHKNIDLIDEMRLEESIQQYVEKNKVDFQDILRKIYIKEKDKLEKIEAEQQKKQEISILKKKLVREGKVKVPEEYLDEFSDYQIDKNGFHCV